MKKLLSLSVAAILAVSMSISAMATNFTPSVEQKPAPDVDTIEVKDENGNVVTTPASDLVVTPISESDEASEEIKTMLQNAKEQISNAESLTELTPDLDAVIPEGMVADDLVVRDLIDVSVVGAAADILKANGSIAVKFKLGVDPDDFLAVLHNYEGSKWEVIPSDRVTIHENGDVTVIFTSLSPVAFVVGKDAISIDENGPASPDTAEIAEAGSTNAAVTAVCGFACVAIGLALLVVLLKKKA